jgi:hypothetical protein
MADASLPGSMAKRCLSWRMQKQSRLLTQSDIKQPVDVTALLISSSGSYLSFKVAAFISTKIISKFTMGF